MTTSLGRVFLEIQRIAGAILRVASRTGDIHRRPLKVAHSSRTTPATSRHTAAADANLTSANERARGRQRTMVSAPATTNSRRSGQTPQTNRQEANGQTNVTARYAAPKTTVTGARGRSRSAPTARQKTATTIAITGHTPRGQSAKRSAINAAHSEMLRKTVPVSCGQPPCVTPSTNHPRYDP